MRVILSGYLLLVTVAALWGLAFAFQIEGMNHLGPYSFMAPRFSLAVLGMLPLLWLWPAEAVPRDNGWWLWAGGFGAGLLMFCASAFQQHGLQYTTAGNAGFITALYVVIVPLLARFAGFKPGLPVFIGAMIATFGLYLLSFDGGFRMTPGDGLILMNALCWALHLLWLGWVAPRTDVIRMSTIQFATCAVLSWIFALAVEAPTLDAIAMSWRSLLYVGLVATSICFTLQALAQQHVSPSHTALILCLESVFAALGGWWLLNESMTPRAITGCVVMFCGILLAQLANAHNPKETETTAAEV